MAETAPDSRYRALLNAIPLWAFVVDEDVRVQDLNDAAAAAFAPAKTVVLDRRGGEVLRCLHALDATQGCGYGPFCPSCVIRNAVKESMGGGHVSRRRATVTLVSAGLKRQFELLITANPMPGTDEPLALLVIEDVSELSTLRGIIPICAKCKQVRNDQEYWQSVETYVTEHMGVGSSHGVCPTCEQQLDPAAADD